MTQAADTQASSELSRKIQLLQAKLSSESKTVAELTKGNKALKQVGESVFCTLIWYHCLFVSAASLVCCQFSLSVFTNPFHKDI